MDYNVITNKTLQNSFPQWEWSDNGFEYLRDSYVRLMCGQYESINRKAWAKANAILFFHLMLCATPEIILILKHALDYVDQREF